MELLYTNGAFRKRIPLSTPVKAIRNQRMFSLFLYVNGLRFG